MKHVISNKQQKYRMLLICMFASFFFFPSFGQKKTHRKASQKKNIRSNRQKGKVNQKIDYIMFLNNDALSKEEQKNDIINVFNKCPEQQQREILAFMVKAITDSLNADKKQSAMECIDIYRMIASPDDEYLGSLVVTEGKYYYEKMDEKKLYELQAFLNSISSRSSLNYSNEISEIEDFVSSLLYGCKDILGYWVLDLEDMPSRSELCGLYIYKDALDNYHVKADYDYSPQKTNIEYYISDSPNNKNFTFSQSQESIECISTSPRRITYCWTSENLNIGKEELATVLRSGVRVVSNTIIGELARRNTYNLGTSLLGSFGSIAGEIVLNSLIDGLSVSKKSIKTITGELALIDKNRLSATIYANHYGLRSDKEDIEMDSCVVHLNFLKYDIDNDELKNNIVFFINYKDFLRRPDKILSKKEERKEMYKRNPELRKDVKRMNWSMHPYKAVRLFNRKQVEKLKKYNETH